MIKIKYIVGFFLIITLSACGNHTSTGGRTGDRFGASNTNPQPNTVAYINDFIGNTVLFYVE